jgi:hypothetical protein
MARTQPAPQQRPSQPPASRPEPSAQPARADERVPADLRKDLSKASAEEIAKMLGSKAPVIPPAPDEVSFDDPPMITATVANGNGNAPHQAVEPMPGVGASDGGVDLSTIVARLRQLARPRSVKLDALLNGSCEAVSWQDGVLTLGFFEDKFHKKGVEEGANRRIYEELAAEILGAAVSIRCIIAPKPARSMSKSPLVQHAVQAHGAKIVSENQES